MVLLLLFISVYRTFIRYGVCVRVYASDFVLALRACVWASECVAVLKFISLIKLIFCSLAFSMFSARSFTLVRNIKFIGSVFLFIHPSPISIALLLFEVLKISNVSLFLWCVIFKECAIKRWKIRSSAYDHKKRLFRQSHDLQIKTLPSVRLCACVFNSAL